MSVLYFWSNVRFKLSSDFQLAENVINLVRHKYSNLGDY
uniref:Uncharacterized protein n=1 Tax=Anguilla anguilla TaxID=7936 RepID=A0A0E9VC88_ANGAN